MINQKLIRKSIIISTTRNRKHINTWILQRVRAFLFRTNLAQRPDPFMNAVLGLPSRRWRVVRRRWLFIMRRWQRNLSPLTVTITLTIAWTVHRLIVQQTFQRRPLLVRVLSHPVVIHSLFIIFVRNKVVSSKFSSGVLFFNNDVLIHSRDRDWLWAMLQAGSRVRHRSDSGRVVVLFVFWIG